MPKQQKSAKLAMIFRALSDPTRLRIFQAVRFCGAEVALDGDSHSDTTCTPPQQTGFQVSIPLEPAGVADKPGELSVGAVCCQFDISMATMSHHLRELRLAGLIKTEKRGRFVYCSAHPKGLDIVQEFLEAPVRPPARRAARGKTPGSKAKSAPNTQTFTDDLWMI